MISECLMTFQFLHFDFPIHIMPCHRVICAECLTRLALNNNLRGVQRFLSKMDRPVPMEIFITIQISALTRPIIDYLNVPTETTDIGEHILKVASLHEDLSFAVLVASREYPWQRWIYAVHPFYSVILHCNWVSGQMIRMILKSGVIDPFETQIRGIRRYQKPHDDEHNFLLRP